ncbi:MAG: penicillin acylase family protein [Bacteroidales bacterium]|nr:penicillin acylase family protein [Bacteroidales bacterium]
MKTLKIILLSIVLLIVFVGVGAWIFLKQTAPQYDGEIEISGLQNAVSINYDQFGVPYIDAQNATDAYMALGYVHAQERLFQMEMIRRLATGQLAEILGPDLVSVDKSMLALGIKDMGERSAENYFSELDAPFKIQAMAYLNGINTFIDQGNLPIEFTLMGFKPNHFTPSDIYSTIGYMSLTFTAALTQDPLVSQLKNKLGNSYLIDLGIDSISNLNNSNADEAIVFASISKSYEKILQMIPSPVWEASNNWAMSAKKSKSGKVLLANDTHIAYSQPSVWFEAVINYPGFTMAGYYLAGVPYAVMGHNQHYGWGLTIFPFDNMDLYREKQNPENEQEFWNKDHWENYQEKTYSIQVKGAEEEKFHLRYTKHGPVLNDVYPDVAIYNESPISLWWSLHTMESEAIEALYHFNNATNFDSFEQGIAKVDLLGLNIVYGDKADNIAWWGTGKIPIRPAHVNPNLILDGSSGLDDVLGFYPVDKNPRSINPESGLVHTANNAPTRVDGILYPGYYYPGLRADRIKELVESQDLWDIESMKRIQNDHYGKRDYFITQNILLPILNTENQNETYKQSVNILKNWDGNTDINSSGAVVYNQFLYFALKELTQDELGEDHFGDYINLLLFKGNIERIFNNESSVWWDKINTDQKENRSEILQLAFNQTVSALEKQLGTVTKQWKWGDVHTLTHVHPIGRNAPFDKVFNVGPFAKSGSNEVIDKEAFLYNAEGIYPVKSGPAMRLLMDFANPNQVLSIIPTGQSGNFMSKHYEDQAQMFVDGEYKSVYLNASDAKCKSVLKLIPE